MWISRSIGDNVEGWKTSAAQSAQASNNTSTRSVQSSGDLFSTNTVYPGQISNHAKADLEVYNHLLSLDRQRSRSLLRKIIYCQSGLSNDLTRSFIQGFHGAGAGGSSGSSGATNFQLQSSRTAMTRPLINPRSIINHEFLIIVMKIGGEERFFLAEKCGAGEDCGINIKLLPGLDDFRSAQVSSFDCEDTPMGLERLMRILEDHDPDYTVHEKNCWEYAVQSTKKLLFACEEITGKTHFGDQAKLVGGKVTMHHIKDMAIRGFRALGDMLTSRGLGH